MTNPLQLISDTADGLADLESALGLLSRRVAENQRRYVMSLETAARLLKAGLCAWQESQPVAVANEVSDSDFAAFEQAEGKSNG